MVKIDNFYRTNEEYISITFVCLRVIDRFRFLSNSSNSLVKTLVYINHKTLQNLKNELIGDDNILKTLIETKTLISKNRYEIDSFEVLKKDLPKENDILQESLKKIYI